MALDALTATGSQRLARDGVPPERRTFRRAALARYVGQSSEIEVRLPDGDFLPCLAELFGAGARTQLRLSRAARRTSRVDGICQSSRVAFPTRPRLPDPHPAGADTGTGQPVRRFPDIGWHETPVADRFGLTGATPRRGPLIIQEYDATCLVPHGFDATCDPFGNIRLLDLMGAAPYGKDFRFPGDFSYSIPPGIRGHCRLADLPTHGTHGHEA